MNFCPFPFVIMVFGLENHHLLPIILKFLLCFTNHGGHFSGVHLMLHIHQNHDHWGPSPSPNVYMI
jgi:hypothetical protein